MCWSWVELLCRRGDPPPNHPGDWMKGLVGPEKGANGPKIRGSYTGNLEQKVYLLLKIIFQTGYLNFTNPRVMFCKKHSFLGPVSQIFMIREKGFYGPVATNVIHSKK